MKTPHLALAKPDGHGGASGQAPTSEAIGPDGLGIMERASR
jgi:hypothetical protein